MQNGLLGTLLGGIVLVSLIVPWVKVSLERDDIDINGLIVNFVEVVEEAVQRSVQTPNPEE